VVQVAVLQPQLTAINCKHTREDREGTALTAIKTQTFRDLPQDNRSLPATKILVEMQRIAA